MRCFKIWADEAAITDMLVTGGFLDTLAADDFEKIEQALERMVEAAGVREIIGL